jgi:albonoursin synthase
MDLFEALARKRACRQFTTEPVDPEHLQKLVYAAGRAPTASNRPYRHCILVDDPRVIRAIRQISPSLVADPPVLLIIFTDREVALAGVGRVAERASMVDAGAAGENVLLAATALGLGSQFAMISVMAGIRTVLGLPDHCRVDLILPIGHPSSTARSVKASEKANVVYHNQYGTLR